MKPQYYGHLMGRADSFEKTLMLEKTEGRKKGITEDEMVGLHHQLNAHEFEQTLKDNKDREVWCAAVHGVTRVRHD